MVDGRERPVPAAEIIALKSASNGRMPEICGMPESSAGCNSLNAPNDVTLQICNLPLVLLSGAVGAIEMLALSRLLRIFDDAIVVALRKRPGTALALQRVGIARICRATGCHDVSRC